MRIVQSSDFPDDTTPDDLNRANSILDYVHSKLVPTLPVSASNPAHQAADLVACYIQTILRRSLQLFEGAIHENRQNRRLVFGEVTCLNDRARLLSFRAGSTFALACAIWPKTSIFIDVRRAVDGWIAATLARCSTMKGHYRIRPTIGADKI